MLVSILSGISTATNHVELGLILGSLLCLRDEIEALGDHLLRWLRI